jgi:hypothetical protein
MTAYFDERLANMGHSVSAGTPDWLKYEGDGVVLAVAEAKHAGKGAA